MYICIKIKQLSYIKFTERASLLYQFYAKLAEEINYIISGNKKKQSLRQFPCFKIKCLRFFVLILNSIY